MTSRAPAKSESDKYGCAHRVGGALHPELEGDLEAGRRARRMGLQKLQELRAGGARLLRGVHDARSQFLRGVQAISISGGTHPSPAAGLNGGRLTMMAGHESMRMFSAESLEASGPVG
ncbi:hypothetical protein HETIRDRAFT_108119 [Heterobasidion irregulare TC 32-1]|uniref:Uncharacterized protein n=1 Tax=Heterobasidion irregulare (strain TC 32-1) TaxID=747525 RepID=W4JP37_HETIT|nr:uncharacterized protein HETIRDRAFT_108119 [Heterobasidion irregulare TC 32-1]ETW75288.1 hypothetical protein HETIRDRAFT_108119 [Heterobasidion irregulare TC 32-1]